MCAFFAAFFAATMRAGSLGTPAGSDVQGRNFATALKNPTTTVITTATARKKARECSRVGAATRHASLSLCGCSLSYSLTW